MINSKSYADKIEINETRSATLMFYSNGTDFLGFLLYPRFLQNNLIDSISNETFANLTNLQIL